jgi:hypothetical protein
MLTPVASKASDYSKIITVCRFERDLPRRAVPVTTSPVARRYFDYLSFKFTAIGDTYP